MLKNSFKPIGLLGSVVLHEEVANVKRPSIWEANKQKDRQNGHATWIKWFAWTFGFCEQ